MANNTFIILPQDDNNMKPIFNRPPPIKTAGGGEDDNHQIADIILATLFALVFLIGTTGNALVYYYFKVKRRIRRTIPELLFSYVALVDFLSSFVNSICYFNLSINHRRWYYGQFLCKAVPSLGAVLTTIPGGIFVIIAFDRERAIIFRALKHFTEQFIKRSVALVVMFAFVLNLYLMVELEMDENKWCKMKSLRHHQSYWIPSVISFVLRDLTIIFVFVFTNIRIVSRQRRSQYRDVAWKRGALWLKRRRDSLKTIRLMVVMATSYFVLTMPTDIFQMVVLISHLVKQPIRETPIRLLVYSCIQWVQTTNSCANILIYYKMHQGFRKFFRKFFRRLKCKFNVTVYDDFLEDSL